MSPNGPLRYSLSVSRTYEVEQSQTFAICDALMSGFRSAVSKIRCWSELGFEPGIPHTKMLAREHMI